MYDAIVVGARCAGSTTAMLLARRGHRVLLLDRDGAGGLFGGLDERCSGREDEIDLEGDQVPGEAEERSVRFCRPLLDCDTLTMW